MGSPVSHQLLQLQLFLNFLKFWTLLVDFIEGHLFLLRYMFRLFEANFSFYSGFRLGLCMLWTIWISWFYDVLSLKFKVGFSVVVLSGVSETWC